MTGNLFDSDVVCGPPGSQPGRRRTGQAALRALLAALVLLVAVPAVLLAHTQLRWSRPADGEVLTGSPAEIRLRFTTPVEAAYTQLQLLAPDGSEVPLPRLTDADGRREFFTPLAQPLPPGDYTVAWRTVAADGHVIQGSFRFTVEPAPGDTLAAPLPPPDPAAASPVEHHTHDLAPAAWADAGSALAVAIRFLHFVALLGLIGAAAFRLGVATRLPSNPHPPVTAAAAAARARGIGWIALALLVPVIVGRLWLQSATLHGPGDAWSPELLGTMLSSTTWGRAWLLQVGAAVVVLVGLLLARGTGAPARGWPIVALGVLVLAAVPGLSGHAATTEGTAWLVLLNDTFHVLGAGTWLGTLALVLLAGIPAALRAGTGKRAEAVAALVNRFSPVALGAAALVVTTGIVNALFHFNAPAELWATGYGRTLLLKLALLLPVLALGAYNWRVVRPALGTDAATSRLRRSATAEITVGVLVLLVTAVLVATPRP